MLSYNIAKLIFPKLIADKFLCNIIKKIFYIWRNINKMVLN